MLNKNKCLKYPMNLSYLSDSISGNSRAETLYKNDTNLYEIAVLKPCIILPFTPTQGTTGSLQRRFASITGGDTAI